MNTIVADMHQVGAPREARMVTTKAGITIGIAHQWLQPQYPTTTEQLLQAALLEPRTARPLSPLQRASRALWKWL